MRFTALLFQLKLAMGGSGWVEDMEAKNRLEAQYRDLRPPFAGYLAALSQLITTARNAEGQDDVLLSVLRAQLTSDELSAMAVHALTSEGAHLKTLIENAGMLAHWEAPEMLNGCRQFFMPGAFSVGAGAEPRHEAAGAAGRTTAGYGGMI